MSNRWSEPRERRDAPPGPLLAWSSATVRLLDSDAPPLGEIRGR